MDPFWYSDWHDPLLDVFQLNDNWEELARSWDQAVDTIDKSVAAVALRLRRLPYKRVARVVVVSLLLAILLASII